MCIFTGPVARISNTCIFGRLNTRGEQYLAYSMSANLPQEMAMILPLPVVAGRSLEFIDLSGCSDFFDTLDKAFQGPRPRSAGSLSLSLEVVEVGSFEASFVPTLDDFGRLDPRFRLDTTIWSLLPQYRDYGFAVFKLKSGDHEVHPMAFKFSTRLSNQLFFPTVHVHDGTVPDSEHFDHQLYCQAEGELQVDGWQASPYPLGTYFHTLERTEGLLRADSIGYKCRILGEYRNQDVLVPMKKLRPGLRRKGF